MASKGATAHEMSAAQKDISVAEFFQKNRHLLGFDNPRKALLTTIKEAIDNSLDACEEAGILPDLIVKIEAIKADPTHSVYQSERFIITVSDNGPGIVRKNIGKVFAKLLYGSKFHRLRMSRGQQGIGISAAGMYGQLTTGKPTIITSKIKNEKAYRVEVSIDTKRNEPVEHESGNVTWDREHGTEVSIELVGRYNKGKSSVDEYLQYTSISNPHAKITYHTPDGTTIIHQRGEDELPEQPKEIKPHPYGIELGMFIKMVKTTEEKSICGFLSTDFCKIPPGNSSKICREAGLKPTEKPLSLSGEEIEKLFKCLKSSKLQAPPTDCIVPIGEDAIIRGLAKTIKANFYTSVTRPPKVYRGNPFVIEAGVAYGTGILVEEEKTTSSVALAEGEEEKDDVKMAQVIRYANRVPLLSQQTACVTYKAALRTAWKNYGVPQSKGAMPQGPLTIFVHMASVWVPFTSEAKEAIAEYDEIMEEVKLALQECGRKLGSWLRKRQKAKNEMDRRETFYKYIEEVAESCGRVKLGKLNVEKLKKNLGEIAKEVTGGNQTDELLNIKPEEDELNLSKTLVLTENGLKGDVKLKEIA